MQRSLIASALFFLVTLARTAAADDCTTAGKEVVAFAQTDPETPLAASVKKQLRVTLAERSVALCEGETGATPLATVKIEPMVDRVMVTLVVKDALTNKTVSRELDLATTPEDARALLVAQAADELLRASWAELLLANAPKPTREVPVVVQQAVRPAESTTPPIVPAAPRLEVGAGLGLDVFGGGHTLLGPEIDVATFPFRRAGLRARGGYRVATAVDAPHGSIDSTAWTMGIGPIFGVTERTGRAGVDAFAEAFFAIATFDPHAGANATATKRTGTAVYADVGAEGWLALAAPLRVTAAAMLGAPLRTTRIADGSETVTAISGVMVSGHLGVRGAF